MAEYIPKSLVLVEIESKRKYAQTLGDNAINSSMQQFYDGMKQGCIDILSSINTLEVKEVDLEKLAEQTYPYPCPMWFAGDDKGYEEAEKKTNSLREAFKLGFIKAQKGEKI